MAFRLKIVLGFVSILLCNACAVNNSRLLARRAVDNFHRQFNEDLYSEIYHGADNSFRASGTESKFVEFLSKNKQKLGNVLSSEEIKWQVNFNRANGYEIITVDDTRFEKGEATETFVWYITNDSTYLISYKIDLPIDQ